MLLNRMLNIHKLQTPFGLTLGRKKIFTSQTVPSQAYQNEKIDTVDEKLGSHDEGKANNISSIGVPITSSQLDPIMPTRNLQMVVNKKDPIVLPFEDVPGPRSLKYLATLRQYLSEFSTQLMVNVLSIWLNVGTLIRQRKPIKNLSSLFDEYGPVVRFISPIGSDIVLLNHPDHIQKVYALEGDFPVRSALDSLNKYRMEHDNFFKGLYAIHGEEWNRHRLALSTPFTNTFSQQIQGIYEICDLFTNKIYNMRNHQDEFNKDLHKEIHKWAFDCLGLILFSENFQLIESTSHPTQSDVTWLYHNLDKATEAIAKCEAGLQLWKLFDTPAWNSLVKHCDNLDRLIGKRVLEFEQNLIPKAEPSSVINSMLLNEHMNVKDITTTLIDMFLIGVNTITSSMSFLVYFLAKHQHVQKMLSKELENVTSNTSQDWGNLKEQTPYLQACIKETLRLVPPIPVLTRILPRNIVLDKYNIPKGTMIIMSMQDASLKESNFDDATKFCPERWLTADTKDYHAFASIPFGYGARKCLGQNVAETMLTVLTVKLLEKYKLEYHYGDIRPTRSFIVKPSKPLKIRFIDRV